MTTQQLPITAQSAAQPTRTTVQPLAHDTEELRTIDVQRRRFVVVAIAAIVVSFVHMAAALALFARSEWYDIAAALGMTALVDVATWAVAEYRDYAARRKLKRSAWINVLFAFALIISMFLNGAYLWANSPDETKLPGFVSGSIAISFAIFVPLLIAVASLARGELTDDRLTLLHTAKDEADSRARLAQAEAELRSARAAIAQRESDTTQAEQQLAQLRAEAAQRESEAAQIRDRLAHQQTSSAQTSEQVAQLRATAAQLESDRAQLQTQLAHTSQELAQLRAGSAQANRQLAHLETTSAQLQEARAQIADLSAQLGEARAQADPLDRVALAQQLIERNISQRDAAQILGIKESTLRNRLKARSTQEQ